MLGFFSQMLPVAAGILAVALVGDLIGRAVVLTSVVAVRAAANVAWYTGSTFLTSVTRMAAQYLGTESEIETHKLLSWSESENRVVISHENSSTRCTRL